MPRVTPSRVCRFLQLASSWSPRPCTSFRARAGRSGCATWDLYVPPGNGLPHSIRLNQMRHPGTHPPGPACCRRAARSSCAYTGDLLQVWPAEVKPVTHCLPVERTEPVARRIYGPVRPRDEPHACREKNGPAAEEQRARR